MICPKRLRTLCVSLLAVAPATLPHAEGLASDRFSVDGFGTLGMAYNNSDEAEFVRDISQPDGVGDGWSPDVDSRLGLQLGYKAAQSLDIIAQVVSRYNPEGTYSPELNWAFLRYSPDPGLQLRLGRVGLDSYMLADSKDVGYSYLWVRPPADYYGHRHFNFLDGGDFTFKRPFGDALAWIKVYAGVAKAETNLERVDGQSVTLDAEGDIFGGHLNYATGPWHLQISHSRIEYELDAPPVYLEYIEQLRFYSPDFADILSSWQEPIDMRLFSAGVAYADGPLQVQTMFNRIDQETDENDTDSAFITVGYRLGKITPYLTWSGSRTDGVSYAEMGLPVQGDYGMTQQTKSIGARYDFFTNMDLKLQYDHVDVEQSGLLWSNAEPGWSGDASLFSIGIDFVF